MVKLAIQNEDYAQTSLTPGEMDLLTKQWKDMFLPMWSMERTYINSRWGLVQGFIEAAKNALDELAFGGFNAGNQEIGISAIRPGHVGLVESAACESNNVWAWKHDCLGIVNAVGLENWIHSPAGATTAFQISDHEAVFPMYIVEENCSPKIQVVKMDIGRTNVLHYDVAACRMSDAANGGLTLIPLPTTFWLPNADVFMALGFKRAGFVEPRLGGFTIGEGVFLNATNYIASTNTVTTQTVASF